MKNMGMKDMQEKMMEMEEIQDLEMEETQEV